MDPSMQDSNRVVGVGNIPIPVVRTQDIPLPRWGASTRCSSLVVPTLQDFDVILGMDVMTVLDIRTDIKFRLAEPSGTHVCPGSCNEEAARTVSGHLLC